MGKSQWEASTIAPCGRATSPEETRGYPHSESLTRVPGRPSDQLTKRRQRLARTENKIRGLIEFIANGDRSDYIADTLRVLEAMAKQEKATITALERQARQPIALPSLDQLLGSVLDEGAAIEGDPLSGREKLTCCFRTDGDTYVARSALLPLMALEPESIYRRPSKGPAIYRGSSGDRI